MTYGPTRLVDLSDYVDCAGFPARGVSEESPDSVGALSIAVAKDEFHEFTGAWL